MAKQGHYMSNELKAMICEDWVMNPNLTFQQLGLIYHCHHTHVSKVISAYRTDKLKVNKTILSTWETHEQD